MGETSTPSIFRTAFAEVTANWGEALRLITLPYLVYMLLEIPYVLLLVRSFNGEIIDWLPLMDLYGVITFAFFIAAVAVGWHRFMLLSEAPAALGPRVHPLRWGRFALAWWGIGVVLFLGLFLFVALPLYGVLGAVAPGAVEALVDSFYVLGGEAPPRWLIVLLLACGWLLIVTYLYFLFRCAMGLPAIAVRQDRFYGLRASWRLTRGFGRAILRATLPAGLGIVCLIVLPSVAYYAGVDYTNPASITTFRVEYSGRAIVALGEAVVALFGAAILNAIYRGIPEKRFTRGLRSQSP